MKVMQLCHDLRKNSIHAECDLAGRSLKAQMKNANRMGAKYSLVIGDDEAEKGCADIKNMETGEAQEIELCPDKIAEFLKNN